MRHTRTRREDVGAPPTIILLINPSLFRGDFPSASSLPANIGDVTELASIQFAGSDLRGSLPDSLCTLTGLTDLLFQDASHLTGPVPACLQDLILLEEVDFRDTDLRGPMFGVCRLAHLRTLLLSGTSLSGDLGGCIWQPDIENIDLYKLPISVLVDEAMCTSVKLKSLNVESTRSSGFLPSCIESLSLLEVLRLGYTKISGSIDPSFCNLETLEFISLPDTKITGGFINCIGNIKNLQELDLDNTGISGNLTDSLCDLTKLKLLRLRNTHAAGHIPACIGDLQSLRPPTYSFC